jgi:GTP 3',8-cyclase
VLKDDSQHPQDRVEGARALRLARLVANRARGELDHLFGRRAAVRENDCDDGHRHAGPAAARSADLGHRSLQLPLRLLLPSEIFGRDYEFLERAELLTFEEIERLARIFVGDHGVSKIRLTGGEPLVRREVERLVAMLARIPGLGDLAMTTNGSALARKAQALKDGGLCRITVSLDSLDNEVFAAINDVGFPVERVLAGIEAAAAAGLGAIKINMVVKRGVNEHGVVAMARHFRGSGHIVRFIEYMDVGHSNGWRMDDVVPAAEIVAMIDAEMPLKPVAANYPGEVVERWRYRDGRGEIGVIASVTRPFCGGCTRARLSADGKLFTCLFAVAGHDLRALLRGGASDAETSAAIGGIWRMREDRYSELRTAATAGLPKVEMSYIGG